MQQNVDAFNCNGKGTKINITEMKKNEKKMKEKNALITVK